jgi:hypothetical protein
MYYSVITTAALFIAIIINDVIQKNESSISSHAFLGLLSTLAVLFLCMKGAEMVAWGIIILPIFVIILSFVLVYFSTSNTDASSVPASTTFSSMLAAATTAPVKPAVQTPASASIVTPSGAGCTVRA